MAIFHNQDRLKKIQPTTIQSNIETAFRKKVQNDKNVKNAYLLVHSEKYNIQLNIAEGKTGIIKADTIQPNHLASVGKLFTAIIIGMLHERQMLDFNDFSYRGKALRFMARKVIREVLKLEKQTPDDGCAFVLCYSAAMQLISTSTNFGSAPTWMVSRAGGSSVK